MSVLQNVFRTKRFVVMSILCAILLALVLLPVDPTVAQAPLTVQMRSVAGVVMGTATVAPTGTGELLVDMNLSGFDPVAGLHRLAVADVGTCNLPIPAARTEIAVLPPVEFSGSGSADYRVVTDAVSPARLIDRDGSALLLHADTRPESEIIACGVIVPPTPQREQSQRRPPQTPHPRVPPAQQQLVAQIVSIPGAVMGRATFTPTATGNVVVDMELSGFDPVAGLHRLAIAEVGVCDLPTSPSLRNEVVVLPPVEFSGSGSADYRVVTDALSRSVLFGRGGSALLLHADTRPESEIIACGVIVPVTVPRVERPSQQPPKFRGPMRRPARRR